MYGGIAKIEKNIEIKSEQEEDNSEEVFLFSEEDGIEVTNATQTNNTEESQLNLTMTCTTEQEMNDDDSGDLGSQVLSATQLETQPDQKEDAEGDLGSQVLSATQLENQPDQKEDAEGVNWKLKFEEERALRIDDKRRTQENLKHARRCNRDLRQELRELKRVCYRNQRGLQQIGYICRNIN